MNDGPRADIYKNKRRLLAFVTSEEAHRRVKLFLGIIIVLAGAVVGGFKLGMYVQKEATSTASLPTANHPPIDRLNILEKDIIELRGISSNRGGAVENIRMDVESIKRDMADVKRMQMDLIRLFNVRYGKEER